MTKLKNSKVKRSKKFKKIKKSNKVKKSNKTKRILKGGGASAGAGSGGSQPAKQQVSTINPLDAVKLSEEELKSGLIYHPRYFLPGQEREKFLMTKVALDARMHTLGEKRKERVEEVQKAKEARLAADRVMHAIARSGEAK